MRALHLVGAALAAAAPVAHGQTAAEPMDLGEIVITVQSMDYPMSLVIDPAMAQQPLPASDGASFLKNIPGFAVSRKGGTDGDPAFRGLGGSRLNILLDGASTYGGCPNRMDPPTAYVYPESYDEVIIDKGPQSVLYGAGSAATVRFERRTPRFEQPGYRGSGALTGGSFGRNDQMFDIAGGAQAGFVRVIGTRSDADNYKDGDGTEVHSFHTRWSGTAIAGWTPDNDTRVELTMERSDGEAAYADRLMDGVAFDRSAYALDLERSGLGKHVDAVALKLFQSNIDHVMDNFSLRTPSGMPRVMNPERTTTGARVTSDLALGDSNTATVGLDYQRSDHTTRMAMGKTPSVEGLPRRDTADFSQYGVFGEYEHGLGDSARLLAGLRLDRAEAEALRMTGKMDPDGYGGAAPGETASDVNTSGFLRYERDLAAIPATVYAGLGRAERSPDFWERDRVFDLDTEKHTQVDIGATYRTKKLRAALSLFSADISDYILITDNGDGAANIDASTYGGEADIKYALSPHWDLGATLSYVRGSNDTDDVPLAQMPPLEGSLALNFHRSKYEAGLLVRRAQDQDRVDIGSGTIYGTDIGETQGFTVVSINAGYHFSPTVKLAAGIDNLFDETYSEHLASGSADLGAVTGRVNEPGRTVWLKLSAEF
ncbi:MAG TPA: TonB-dependent copper receptor [Arenicellales bacterium]|nr:TonB-dependent copper receptor [Arenicellales bacterium]